MRCGRREVGCDVIQDETELVPTGRRQYSRARSEFVEDQVHEFFDRGFVRPSIERNRPVLQQANPIADIENVGIVVRNNDD